MEIVDTTPLMTLIKFSRNRDRAILKLFFIDLGMDSVRSIHLYLFNCSIWCMIRDVMPSRRLSLWNNPTDEGHIEQGISDLTCHMQSTTTGRGAPCWQPYSSHGKNKVLQNRCRTNRAVIYARVSLVIFDIYLSWYVLKLYFYLHSDF